MNARRAEALSSARLARAVLARVPSQRIPARQIGLQVRAARSRIPIVRVRNHRCDVLGANGLGDRDFYVVKTLDSVISNHPFQHRLEQSSVALDSSDLLGALHPCLTDQDSMFGKRTGKNPRLWTPRSQLKVSGQPAHPTHKLTKLSKHSRLDGEPCPCRSSTACWKVVPKSRMFKHR